MLVGMLLQLFAVGLIFIRMNKLSERLCNQTAL